MDLFVLMKVLIVLFGISIVFLEIRKMYKLGFHWLTTAVVIIGLYWAGYYTYLILQARYGWAFPEHGVFVRSGILLTMAICLAKAIRANRSI